MTHQYRPPELLASHHLVEAFICSSSEQTAWLRDFARQSHASGSTKVLVVTAKDSNAVVAYYAWRMADIQSEQLPSRMKKGEGRYPQPVVLLARLGVHNDHVGRGIGAALLRDVILRMMNLGATIGCRGLLTHCENSQAEAFYRHLIPGFLPSPTDPLHLLLLMKDVRALLMADL